MPGRRRGKSSNHEGSASTVHTGFHTKVTARWFGAAVRSSRIDRSSPARRGQARDSRIRGQADGPDQPRLSVRLSVWRLRLWRGHGVQHPPDQHGVAAAQSQDGASAATGRLDRPSLALLTISTVWFVLHTLIEFRQLTGDPPQDDLLDLGDAHRLPLPARDHAHGVSRIALRRRAGTAADLPLPADRDVRGRADPRRADRRDDLPGHPAARRFRLVDRRHYRRPVHPGQHVFDGADAAPATPAPARRTRCGCAT